MINRAAVLGLFAALLVSPCVGSARTLSSEQQNGANQENSSATQNNNSNANQNNSNTWSEQELRSVVKSVRHQILSLPEYSVFDWLTFGVQGHTVILNGYASRPILKSEAEKVVKGIKGVDSVQNNIKVLPYSPLDDRIRVQTLARIYGQPALRRYTSAPISQDLYPTVSRMAGGITQDPPQGYFAIHIIVDNGHVTLEGVVDNAMDAEIADAQANSVPGVFSVSDDIVVPNQQNKEKVK
jgi:hyperosmotically inducible protein